MTNKSDIDGEVDLNQPDPWKKLRSSGLFMFGGQQWNGDRLVLAKWVGAGGNLSFRNFWRVGLERWP